MTLTLISGWAASILLLITFAVFKGTKHMSPTTSGDEQISISVKEYEQLSEDSRFLCALRNAGVDNWSGYEEAQEMIEEWDSES